MSTLSTKYLLPLHSRSRIFVVNAILGKQCSLSWIILTETRSFMECQMVFSIILYSHGCHAHAFIWVQRKTVHFLYFFPPPSFLMKLKGKNQYFYHKNYRIIEINFSNVYGLLCYLLKAEKPTTYMTRVLYSIIHAWRSELWWWWEEGGGEEISNIEEATFFLLLLLLI